MKKILIMVMAFIAVLIGCSDNATNAENADKWDGIYIVSTEYGTSEREIISSGNKLSFNNRVFVGKYSDGYFWGAETAPFYGAYGKIVGVVNDTIEIHINKGYISGATISVVHYYEGEDYPPCDRLFTPFTGHRK